MASLLEQAKAAGVAADETQPSLLWERAPMRLADTRAGVEAFFRTICEEVDSLRERVAALEARLDPTRIAKTALEELERAAKEFP